MMNIKFSKKLGLRVGVGAGILCAVVLFRILNLGDYLSLDYIKASEGRLRILYEENRILVIAAYIFIYVISTSLSLPGATVLTLAGGALFGFGAGVLIVSFASTMGATLACIVSRFLLRDWVQGKFGDRLRTVNEGLAREGAFYFFTMRLIPLLPFWVINLVMGVTKIPLWTFYWVSQLGMLPGTAVYVNAGKELVKIESLSSILSPSLIFSFAAIGLFPVAVRKLVKLYRTRMGKARVVEVSDPRVAQDGKEAADGNL